MSPMTMLIVFGGIVCGWTMLSVLCGERSRRVRQIEAQNAPVEPAAPTIHTAMSPTPLPKPAAKPAPAAPPAKAK